MPDIESHLRFWPSHYSVRAGSSEYQPSDSQAAEVL